MVFAHIAGVPVEELLPAVYGTAGLWLVARAFAARLLGRSGGATSRGRRGS